MEAAAAVSSCERPLPSAQPSLDFAIHSRISRVCITPTYPLFNREASLQRRYESLNSIHSIGRSIRCIYRNIPIRQLHCLSETMHLRAAPRSKFFFVTLPSVLPQFLDSATTVSPIRRVRQLIVVEVLWKTRRVTGIRCFGSCTANQNGEELVYLNIQTFLDCVPAEPWFTFKNRKAVEEAGVSYPHPHSSRLAPILFPPVITNV